MAMTGVSTTGIDGCDLADERPTHFVVDHLRIEYSGVPEPGIAFCYRALRYLGCFADRGGIDIANLGIFWTAVTIDP
jgi:hypothetical protein